MQDSTEDLKSNPATTQHRSTRSRVLGDQLRGSEQSEDENKDIDLVLGNRLRDLSEWLEDFTENPGNGAHRGARQGRSEDQKPFHQAREAFEKAKKKRYESILDRFQNQESYRDSQTDIRWTEDFCKHLDA